MNSKTFQIDNAHNAHPQARPGIFFALIRITLGALFIMTGVSKLFILSVFGETVGQVLPVAGMPASLIALLIISVEIICGTALLMNQYLRPAVIILGILTATFLYILAIAIIGHRTFVCHCFGIIPFSLSNSGELILNFIILDLLILLYAATIHAAPQTSKSRKWVTIVWILLLIYGEGSAAVFIMDRDISDNPVNLIKINNYLSSREHNVNGIAQYNHIVLIRISDFNCPPCFNDFIGYSETMRHYYDPSHDASRIIGLVEQSGAFSDTLSLYAWGKANNIVFPLVLVPDSIFTQFNFIKSCVVHQQPYGMVRSVYTFPGSEAGRNKLLSAFSQ